MIAALAMAMATAQLPNIVIFNVDDAGYADLTGNVPMPRLANLRSRGISFTNAYTTCPVCGPSRAGLLTGIQGTRYGFEFNDMGDGSTDDVYGLPVDQLTLFERLKTLGYSTATFGKWHEGYTPDKIPNARGVDEFWGILNQSNIYRTQDAERKPFWHNQTQTHLAEYETDEIKHRAALWLSAQTGPFCLYVPFPAVHAPLLSIPKYLGRFPTLTGQKKQIAASLSAIDDAIGAIRGVIQTKGWTGNTIVIFTNDNGGPTDLGADNAPFRGKKDQLFDGGIRVPIVISWPAKLRQNEISETLVSHLDITPTIMAATGHQVSGLDGVDLLPLTRKLNPIASPPHESLYWRKGEQWAIRSGSWKLVHTNNDDKTGYIDGLFNLATDPGETLDVSADHADVVSALVSNWQSWNAGNIPPLWIGP